jgi:hypothetical protein
MIDYPQPGRLYKHYKGGLYEFLFLAKNTETDEIMVVYKSVLFGTNYVRPLSEWDKKTEDGDIRFRLFNN